MKQRRIVHSFHAQCSLHWKDSQNIREFSGYSKCRLITWNEGDVLRRWNEGAVPAVATVNTPLVSLSQFCYQQVLFQHGACPAWNQDCSMVSHTVRFISLRRTLLLLHTSQWQPNLQGCSDGLDLYMCAPSCRHPLLRPHSLHMHVALAQAYPTMLCIRIVYYGFPGS